MRTNINFIELLDFDLLESNESNIDEVYKDEIFRLFEALESMDISNNNIKGGVDFNPEIFRAIIYEGGLKYCTLTTIPIMNSFIDEIEEDTYTLIELYIRYKGKFFISEVPFTVTGNDEVFIDEHETSTIKLIGNHDDIEITHYYLDYFWNRKPQIIYRKLFISDLLKSRLKIDIKNHILKSSLDDSAVNIKYIDKVDFDLILRQLRRSSTVTVVIDGIGYLCITLIEKNGKFLMVLNDKDYYLYE